MYYILFDNVVNITINNINQPTHIFNDKREALWINMNSPIGKTMTDYYNTCEVIVKSLHMKNLTKLVEELGYSVNRKTKPYVWNIKSI